MCVHLYLGVFVYTTTHRPHHTPPSPHTPFTGQRTALFIGTPTPKGLPSDATQECPLVGRVVLMNTPNGGNGNGGDAPGWVPIVVLPPPKGESEGGKKVCGSGGGGGGDAGYTCCVYI